jgi:hypothetical protein
MGKLTIRLMIKLTKTSKLNLTNLLVLTMNFKRYKDIKQVPAESAAAEHSIKPHYSRSSNSKR